MANKKVRATARITLTVEIDDDGVWGADCPIDQIHRQAKEGAIGALERALRRAASPDAQSQPVARLALRIVGEPKVMAVLVEERE